MLNGLQGRKYPSGIDEAGVTLVEYFIDTLPGTRMRHGGAEF